MNVTLHTSLGDINITMFPDHAPKTVANFVGLAKGTLDYKDDAGRTSPTLVLWGEADRIVDPDYGRAYADAIPGARFELLRWSGHLPQLETPHARPSRSSSG